MNRELISLPRTGGSFLPRLVFVTGLLALIITLLAGCAAASHSIPPPSVDPPFTAPPHELQSVAKGLDWLILASTVALGLGVAAYFFLPAHRLSIAAGAASILGVALALKVSLWLVPWLVGGAFVSIVFLVAYEIKRKGSIGAAEVIVKRLKG